MIRQILVTGANGQLGIELAPASAHEGWEVVALGRNEHDLTDTVEITDKVMERPWAAIINGAAYTSADNAESDQMTAWRVNALAPAAFASACATADIPLVQVSTDYVFAGDEAGARDVDDPVSPINVYGASKLGGELAVRVSGVRHAIVRTSWVVSAHGNNFLKTMLRMGTDRDILRVVDDQHGSPTAAADLADALITIAMRLAQDRAAPTGTFHFSNTGAVTWADFASEIFAQSAVRGGPFAKIEPIASSGYPTPARRPANSLLSHDAIRAAYGIAPRPWQQALGEILDELIGCKV